MLRNFAGTGSENIFANGFENAALRTPEFAANQVLNYDRAHRLTSITGVESYQYDAHGRRVLTTRTSDGLKRYQLYSNVSLRPYPPRKRSQTCYGPLTKFCGRSSSMSLFLCVGRRVNVSLK